MADPFEAHHQFILPVKVKTNCRCNITLKATKLYFRSNMEGIRSFQMLIQEDDIQTKK